MQPVYENVAFTTSKIFPLNGGVITRLDLYDVQGRHLDNRSFPGLDTNLDLSTLPNGLYYLIITPSQGITTKHIIKR